MPNLDAIIVPVGGGGMLSGIAIAVKALKPDIKIYAAEPANADDCAKSFAANERIPLQGMVFWVVVKTDPRLNQCLWYLWFGFVGRCCDKWNPTSPKSDKLCCLEILASQCSVRY